MTLTVHIKSEVAKLREAAPGRRFTEFHERMRKQSPSWMRPLYLGAAVVCFAIGVVLAFIPGPAILFFALAVALVATQSSWLAKALDRDEVKIRGWIDSHRRPRARPGH
jgi:hypothetical protein